MNKKLRSWYEEDAKKINEALNNIDKNIKEYKVTELYNRFKTEVVIKKNIEHKIKEEKPDISGIRTITGTFNGEVYEYKGKFVFGIYSYNYIDVFGEEKSEYIGYLDKFDDFTEEEVKKIIAAIGESEESCVTHAILLEELIKRNF